MTTIAYAIYNKTTGAKRLVRAANRAQALRHVAQDDYRCEPVSAVEALDLVAAGVKPETAGAEPPSLAQDHTE